MIGADLRNLHNVGGGVAWRLDQNGVYVDGTGRERTPGAPVTTARIWREFRRELVRWSLLYQLPVELLIATAATETEGNPAAVRHEAGWTSDEVTPDRVSVGLMQTLVTTARSATGIPWMAHALLDPNVSTMAGGAYIRSQARVTRLDPIVVAAAYNAGGIFVEPVPANRFRLRCFPLGTGTHVDRYLRWFNDAVSLGIEASCPVWREEVGA